MQYETESDVPSRRTNTDQVRDPPSPPNRNLHYEMNGHGSPNPARPHRNHNGQDQVGKNPPNIDILTSDEPENSDHSEEDIFSTPNNSPHSSGGEKDLENDHHTSPFDEAREEGLWEENSRLSANNPPVENRNTVTPTGTGPSQYSTTNENLENESYDGDEDESSDEGEIPFSYSAVLPHRVSIERTPPLKSTSLTDLTARIRSKMKAARLAHSTASDGERGSFHHLINKNMNPPRGTSLLRDFITGIRRRIPLTPTGSQDGVRRSSQSPGSQEEPTSSGKEFRSPLLSSNSSKVRSSDDQLSFGDGNELGIDLGIQFPIQLNSNPGQRSSDPGVQRSTTSPHEATINHSQSVEDQHWQPTEKGFGK